MDFTRILVALLVLLPRLAWTGEFVVKNPKSGNVSIAIFDSQQRMVREILRAEPLGKGSHQFTWDELDFDGRPVPAGSYEWRSLQTDGLQSEFLMSIGTSVGERWWPGNHDAPTAIGVGDDSFVVGALCEGVPLLVRCGLDGNVIWEQGQLGPGRIPYDVAIAGGKVYYLQDDGKLFVLDLATKKVIGASSTHKTIDSFFEAQTFVFGKQAKRRGNLPLAEFDLKRGSGWDNIEGLANSSDGVTSNSDDPRTFECLMPNGDYFLRFDFGDTADDTTPVEVQPNGMEPPAIHRHIPDKMKGWLLPASNAGEKTTPIILPQLYDLPRAVRVTDGRLRVKFIPVASKTKDVHWCLRKIEAMVLANRVAANDTSIVFSSNAKGIVWIDPSNGAVIDTAKLPSVRDIALRKDGTVVALVGDSIVTLSRKSKSPVTRATGLIDPVALDVDSQTGNTLVAEGGSSQRVKNFDSRFQLTATNGREGGRQIGRYDPQNFSKMTGIACDGRGGFVVIEGGLPRRTAHFNSAGKIKEWFGGMDFYSTTALDPADPSIGWMRQGEDNILQVKIDYENRDWYPLATYRWTQPFGSTMTQSDDSLFGSRLDYGPWLQRNPNSQRMRCFRRDIDGDGVPDLILEFNAQPLLMVHDESADKLRPLAAVGSIGRIYLDPANPIAAEKLPAAWAEAIELAGGDPQNPKTRNQFARYSWADENGDGQIDGRELQLGSDPQGSGQAKLANRGVCLRVDADLNAWMGNWTTNAEGIYTVLRPERITTCGAPVWPLKGIVGPKTEHRGETASILPTDDGGAFLLLRGNGDGLKGRNAYDIVAHGWGFPSNQIDGMTIFRLDSSGNRVWKTAAKAARIPHPRGQLHGAWHLMGPVRGCIAASDWIEQPCEFWTTDGLYVGGLFDGRDPMDGHDLKRPDSPPDRLYTWMGTKFKRVSRNDFHQTSPLNQDDMLTGGAVAELADGTVVFIGQGANNNPCYRISGWDGWVRERGAIRLDQPSVAAVRNGSGLTGEYFETADFSGSPAITQIDGPLWFDDGKPWPKAIPLKDFSVRWTGTIEPLFSEDYCISIYSRGVFKMFVDGTELTWAQQDYPADQVISKAHSVPIPLRAGKAVSLKIELQATVPNPAFHLNWESLSQPVQHIPASALNSH